MSLPRPSHLALLALLLPTVAMAGEAAVPPLIGKGVDPLVVLNLTSLVASEADFLNAYDNIKQLSTMPPTLNSACLANTACLNKIAKDNNVEALIVGQATPVGAEYDFQLVLYDAPKNRVVRTVSFKLPNSPSAIADGMGPYVKEVVTGVAPVKAEARSLPVASSVDIYDEEDAGPARPTVNRTIPTAGASSGRALADREDPEEIAARQAAEAAAARRRAEEEAARRAAEERAAAEARARAEAEERARAEAEAAAARARATARSAPPPPPAADEDEDFANFSLSSSVSVVADAAPARAVEPEDEDLRPISSSASRSSSTASRSSTSSTASRSSTSSRDLDELDGPSARSSTSRSSSTASRSSTSSRDLDELDGPSARSSTSRSSSTASRSSTSSSRNLDDLDAPSARSSSTASRSGSASSARTSQGSSSGNARVEREPAASDSSVLLAGRLGFAPYQGLGFVTYGAEVGYLVNGGLALIGGVEAYSVQRTIPPENLEEGEPARQWNTILPLNLGLQYLIGQGKAQPYLGAEMLIVPGIVRNSTTPAMGGRGRVGANFFVSDTVALNLNGAVGFLGGKDLATIQEGMKNGAVAPQVSAGTVLFF